MKSFAGKIAVITGGGTGMGRELARQLAAEGCHVAMCDVSEESMAQTKAICEREAPRGTRVSTTLADVSDEPQVLAFRDAVAREHRTDHIHLLFNNAGIGAAGASSRDEREDWERTFGVCWFGVYYCTRAFLPMLIASPEGHLVNTSSVNGFWASLGPTTAHTAYSAAKFAVKGFTEALINDFRAECTAREGLGRDAGPHRHFDHHQLRAHPRPRPEGAARRSGAGGAREHQAAGMGRGRCDQ